MTESLNIGTLEKGTNVVLTKKSDGYRLRGKYVTYLPSVQRYEFSIKLGNGDGTRVLFTKDTFTRYSISLDN